METYSACPNCNSNIDGLEIYQCQACYEHFCKRCNKGSTFVHRNCTPIATGKAFTLPKQVAVVRNSSSSSSSYSSSSSSNYTNTDLSWWESGHTDEIILKSLFLLPFRLIAYAIMIPIWLIRWVLIFAYRVIASIFVIFISIFILLPIKLFLLIISFGYWNLFEDKFIDRLEYIWY